MCKHCKNLTEDKDIVHRFMAVGARRLSKMHGRDINPNDLDVSITLSIEDYNIPNYGATPQVIKMLNEMHK